MTPADRAKAAHDDVKSYYLRNLFENPAPPQPPRVPLWNLEAPVRWAVECHDDGIWIWEDDPASL